MSPTQLSADSVTDLVPDPIQSAESESALVRVGVVLNRQQLDINKCAELCL